MNASLIVRSTLLVCTVATLPVVTALARAPADLLADYSAKAGAPPSPERGRKLFTTNFGKEMGWSCSSCHGAVPTTVGRDKMTDRPIQPMAPAFNPARFTDRNKVENAFRLNCNDVLGRECTAAEKADLISWLMTLKP
jgi:hypothetical protein